MKSYTNTTQQNLSKATLTQRSNTYESYTNTKQQRLRKATLTQRRNAYVKLQ
jgi:hypothetical protein